MTHSSSCLIADGKQECTSVPCYGAGVEEQYEYEISRVEGSSGGEGEQGRGGGSDGNRNM